MSGSGYNIEEQWTLEKMNNYTPLHMYPIRMGNNTIQSKRNHLRDRQKYIVTASDIISQKSRIFQVKEHFEIVLAIFSFTNNETEVKSLDLPCSHAGFMSRS